MAKNSGFSPLNYDIGGKVGSSTFGLDFGTALWIGAGLVVVVLVIQRVRGG